MLNFLLVLGGHGHGEEGCGCSGTNTCACSGKELVLPSSGGQPGEKTNSVNKKRPSVTMPGAFKS